MKAYIVLEIPADQEAFEWTVQAVRNGLATLSEKWRDQIVMTAHINDAAERIAHAVADTPGVPERDMLVQACADLNQAHDELMKARGLDPASHDWPEWTPQANIIRWVERLVGRKLAKTNLWTEFPDTPASDHREDGEKAL